MLAIQTHIEQLRVAFGSHIQSLQSEVFKQGQVNGDLRAELAQFRLELAGASEDAMQLVIIREREDAKLASGRANVQQAHDLVAKMAANHEIQIESLMSSVVASAQRMTTWSASNAPRKRALPQAPLTANPEQG